MHACYLRDTRRQWIADLALLTRRTYNSGYPGVGGLGSPNLGFPYGFWPVTYGGSATGAANLHGENVRMFSRPLYVDRSR